MSTLGMKILDGMSSAPKTAKFNDKTYKLYSRHSGSKRSLVLSQQKKFRALGIPARITKFWTKKKTVLGFALYIRLPERMMK